MWDDVGIMLFRQQFFDPTRLTFLLGGHWIGAQV